MTDQTKRGWLIPIITSIITSLAVVAGAYFSFQGSVESSTSNAEASRLESAFKRIEYLETQMRQQQVSSNAKIVELTTQVFKLQSQLDKDLNIMDMFERFMDGLPFEAWLKQVSVTSSGRKVIRGKFINNAYEYYHGVTNQRYSGAFESEIWGEDIADQFRENDLKVLESKGSYITYEYYPQNPNSADNKELYKKRLVFKMYLELIEGQPLIFGMTMDVDSRQIQ